MAKPWEQYQIEGAAKPWEQYAQPEAIIEPITAPVETAPIQPEVTPEVPAEAAPEGVGISDVLAFSPAGALLGLGKQRETAAAIAEPIATMATGMIAEPVAGLAGLARAPFVGAEQAAEEIEDVRSALTYQPKTLAGQQALEKVGRTLQPVGEALQAAQEFLGEKAYEATDSPLAGALAEAAPVAALSALGLKKPAVPKLPKGLNKSFVKAHKMGYKVPPAMAKGSKTQQFIEGSAGPVPTKQRASVHNQRITNDLIKKDIGYPADAPLSVEGLNAVRAEAGKAYDAAAKLGQIKTDKTYIADLRKIKRPSKALAEEFPQLMRKDIDDLVGGFAKREMSAEALVPAVKQLRADASAGFASPDPGIKALAKANRKVADALEGLLERSAAKTAPEIVPALKASRQQIAKTYTIEKALKGENVDAVALGRALDKGKPMSGAIKDVAEFGQQFKGAAQAAPPQTTAFRPMDLLTGAGGGAYFGPEGLALMGARPAMRAGVLSKPYQAMLARAKPSTVQKIMALPKEQRVAALIALESELQQSGNIDSR